MIQHYGAKEKLHHELNLSFITAIKELDISALLFRCGIHKDSCGLDVIGILKNNRQMCHFNGGLYNLDSLAAYFAQTNTLGASSALSL